MQIKHKIAGKMSKRDLEIKSRNEASAKHGAAMSKKPGKGEWHKEGPRELSGFYAKGSHSVGLKGEDAKRKVAMLKAKVTGEYKPRWAKK